MSAPVLDLRTGELLEGAAAGAYLAEVNGLAAEYVSVSAAHDEALAEARRLSSSRDQLAAALGELLPPEGRADGGSAYVVMEPPARPAQRVSRQGAERHQEALLGIGLGEVVTEYRAPTAAAIRAEKPRVIAAGIPLADLLPEPIPGPPRAVVVPKDAP